MCFYQINQLYDLFAAASKSEFVEAIVCKESELADNE